LTLAISIACAEGLAVAIDCTTITAAATGRVLTTRASKMATLGPCVAACVGSAFVARVPTSTALSRWWGANGRANAPADEAAAAVKDFLCTLGASAQRPASSDDRPGIGEEGHSIVVAGPEADSNVAYLVTAGDPPRIICSTSESGGMFWVGQTGPLHRLFGGVDKRLLRSVAAGRVGSEFAALESLLPELEYAVPASLLTLDDCVELALFSMNLLNVLGKYVHGVGRAPAVFSPVGPFVDVAVLRDTNATRFRYRVPGTDGAALVEGPRPIESWPLVRKPQG
jgi:hypothetical protein